MRETRVLDTELAEALGVDRPRNIRNLIERHREELERYGSLLHIRANLKKPGRPASAYYLNEAQAVLVSVRSDAPNAAAAREAVIRVFMAWRRGELVSPQHLEDQTRDLGISKPITRLLDDHGICWRPANRSRRRAIEFTVAGRRHVYPLPSTSHFRAVRNSVADVRRIISASERQEPASKTAPTPSNP